VYLELVIRRCGCCLSAQGLLRNDISAGQASPRIPLERVKGVESAAQAGEVAFESVIRVNEAAIVSSLRLELPYIIKLCVRLIRLLTLR
jgi:hypothetical protein